MKTYFYISAIAALAILRVCGADFKTPNALEMTICLESNKTQIFSGQPITLVVRFRNTSKNETFSMYDFSEITLEPIGGVGIKVISPSGKDISPHYNPGGGSGAFVNIAPNETRELDINLSEYLKLNEIGTYTITARKDYTLSNHKATEVISNPLEVTVVKSSEKSEAPQTNNPISRWVP